MSDLPPKTHNLPPVAAPTDEEMMADLRARFPELEAEMAQFEKDLAGYPKKLTLQDAEVAQALQDLIGKMKKHKTILGAHKKTEKGPWTKIVNVVQNFFTTREEKIGGLLKEWGDVHEDYLQQKKDEAVRKAEEEAERQRQAAEAAQRDREAAETRAREAREREEAAQKAEQEARDRAAAEEARARAAWEAADAAAAEERRIADERKARERAEKETNADNLKKIRGYMKEAEKLHTSIGTAGDEADDAEIQQLDALIKAGGIVGLLSGPVVHSTLLDEAQTAEIGEVRARLGELRKAVGERLDAKERRRREKARKDEEVREAVLAEQRRKDREADEERSRLAREEREKAETEAAAARQGQKDAQAEVRAARGEQREAFSEQKAAGKVAGKAGQEADRAANRADRIDRRLENSTDADLSRERGNLGTVGSLRRDWKCYLPDDETALRAVLGPLGPHFTTEALSGAAFHWMRAHQYGFTGERVEPAELPGVLFAYETTVQIR